MSDANEISINSLHDQKLEIPPELPILGTGNFVLYPFMIAPLVINDEAVIRLVDDVVRGSRMIGVFALREQEEGQEAPPSMFDRIHEVGCVAMILKMLKIPDGSIRLLVHGLRRARIVERVGEEPYPTARVIPEEAEPVDDTETRAMKKTAREMLARMVEQSSLPNDLIVAANNMEDPSRLADLIASNLSLSLAEQQQILEIVEIKPRLLRIQEILTRELEIARIGSRIQSQVKSTMDRHQRDYLLREQLKAIRRELGDEQDTGQELDELYEQIKSAGLTEAALSVAQKELSRLRAMSPASAEYTVSRTYLDWILALPWSKVTPGKIHLPKARKILDEDHYGLEKVKERILEYLAVIKLRKSIRGPILCLVGPPGVGKTSLGRSVARAMGRKFVRISLGGMRDEAEIRGHRRTYIGAMPGRIIKSLKDAGAKNPVFMLDEIDKLGMDFRGDPASALLEVLDPEQNNSFTDHYLDLPFDLSDVMFITTANSLDPVPGPLLDRMEVLQLSGYTMQDKLKIAHQYLVPRAIEGCGIKPAQITFTDEGLQAIIENYTREAGLRNLEREITNICRKVARRVAEGKQESVVVDVAHVGEALGPARFDRDEAIGRVRQPGVAVGLAWTPSGGDVLFIEVTATPGAARLTLTGQLGEVMKESAQAALTWLHANARRFGLKDKIFSRRNIHVHVPAGAIPKDGPSAGVTMMTAIASLASGRPIREKLAMTGEITLKGMVLPVGGIKEKILAAHRAGIRTIILPRRNDKDLIDVPPEIRAELTIHLADTAEDVLRVAFELPEGRVKLVDAPSRPEHDGRRASESAAAAAGRARARDGGSPADEELPEVPPPPPRRKPAKSASAAKPSRRSRP